MLSTLDIDLQTLARDATGECRDRDGDHLLLVSRSEGALHARWTPVAEFVAGDVDAHRRSACHYRPQQWAAMWQWSVWQLDLPSGSVLHAAESREKDRWLIGIVGDSGSRWFGTTDRRLANAVLFQVAIDQKQPKPAPVPVAAPAIPGWRHSSASAVCVN